MPTRERRARELGIPVDQLPDGRGKSGAQPNGSDHYRWSERRMLSSHGYVKVRVGKSHRLADSNGYAYEHWLVWVSAGNSGPTPNEVMHHINGDKTDNRLENLERMTRSEHNRLHGAGRARCPDTGRLLPLDGVIHDEYPGERGEA